MEKRIRLVMVVAVLLAPVFTGILGMETVPAAAATTSDSAISNLVDANANAVSATTSASSTSSSTASTKTSSTTTTSRATLARAATADTDIASGVNGTVTWTITSDGVLHLSGGSFSYLPANNSPWASATVAANIGGSYASQITAISIDGDLTATSAAPNYSYLFANLPNVTTITGLDKLKMAGVDNMAYMFEYDSALTSVDFGTNDFSDVTSTYGTFYKDTALTSVNMPDANLTSDTTTNQMFSSCTSLTDVSTSGWQIGAVTDVSQMFSTCTSLKTLDVGDWDVSQVTDFHSLFLNDKLLTDLDVAKWDVSKGTNLGYLFYNCAALTSLAVDDWQTGNATTLWSTFAGCSSLTSLNVANWDTSKVTLMAYTFMNCNKLTSLDVNGWDTANVTSLSNMFIGCSGLTDLALNGWDTSKVQNMAYLFASDRGLTTLEIDKWDTGSVTNMTSLFAGASALTSLDLSNFDTSQVTTMTGLFSNMTNLNTLNLSSWDTSAATAYGTVFTGDSKLQHLTLGKDFTFHNATTMALPDASSTSPYTGKWQLATTGTTYTASDLMTTYDGSTMAGQYNWSGAGNVTVKYVDTQGNPIAADDVLSGDVGSAYTTTAKTIAGYTLNTTPANATGNFTSGATTVTYVYTGNLFFSSELGSISFGSHVLSGVTTTYNATTTGTLAVQDNGPVDSTWTLTAQEDAAGFVGSQTGATLPATLSYQKDGVATTIGTTATPIETHTATDHLPVTISDSWTGSTGLQLTVAGTASADTYNGSVTWTLTNSAT
ncbi:BspA family leucine-rich repeat surface protein [Levilactobacillus cerevisiae]|nr:BspA family leucine-rich repeat surface protein [Levilactobacillus cerevisiae]